MPECTASSYKTDSLSGSVYYVSGSGIPKNILGILSRVVTLEYAASGCNEAFGITGLPNVDSINRLGRSGFSYYPSVAIIENRILGALPQHTRLGRNTCRQSTIGRPFILIEPATYHWDKDDVPASQYRLGYPPPQIVDVHNQEATFVKVWINEFHRLRDWDGMQTQRAC